MGGKDSPYMDAATTAAVSADLPPNHTIAIQGAYTNAEWP